MRHLKGSETWIGVVSGKLSCRPGSKATVTSFPQVREQSLNNSCHRTSSHFHAESPESSQDSAVLSRETADEGNHGRGKPPTQGMRGREGTGRFGEGRGGWQRALKATLGRVRCEN